MQKRLRIIISGSVDRERYKRIILSSEKKLDELNIKYGNIVLWEINTRAKKRFGQCRLVRKDCYSIDICERIFEADDHYIEEVIMHELLHSCKDCMNHGKTWKKYADMVNSRFGCNISATGTNEQYGLACDDKKNQEYKYLFKCKGCGSLQGYYKKGKIVKILSGEISGYAVCKCGSREFIRVN